MNEISKSCDILCSLSAWQQGCQREAGGAPLVGGTVSNIPGDLHRNSRMRGQAVLMPQKPGQPSLQLTFSGVDFWGTHSSTPIMASGPTPPHPRTGAKLGPSSQLMLHRYPGPAGRSQTIGLDDKTGGC
jgi:hypothetical protein